MDSLLVLMVYSLRLAMVGEVLIIDNMVDNVALLK